ncbi:MAG: Txe/YoeB family addiction module toxin [Lachnospiraceae bacterium]|nr:Txe/YoeB family addiction module toxin [Lachnospiraceae bacterium]
MSRIQFSEIAWDEYLAWEQQDKKTLRRINALLKEIQRTPFEGSGKPEPLKGEFSGMWSRRINRQDRLVYRYENGIVIVEQCSGHYDDK